MFKNYLNYSTSKQGLYLIWLFCLLHHFSCQASQVALVVKNLSANAGGVRDVGWIPGLGRSPGGGNSNPLQYSCLGNPMD